LIRISETPEPIGFTSPKLAGCRQAINAANDTGSRLPITQVVEPSGEGLGLADFNRH
jgi:hypothetical protein